MIGVIPNPKKTIAIDFPLDKVKLSIERIEKLDKKYKFTKSNPIFNQTTFEASEFLSLGVYIDINLSSVNENKTEITIEIRRKIGSFDQSHEVTNANKHIDTMFEIIAKGLTYSDTEFAQLTEAANSQTEVKGKKKTKWGWIILAIWIILFLLSKWGPFYSK